MSAVLSHIVRYRAFTRYNWPKRTRVLMGLWQSIELGYLFTGRVQLPVLSFRNCVTLFYTLQNFDLCLVFTGGIRFKFLVVVNIFQKFLSVGLIVCGVHDHQCSTLNRRNYHNDVLMASLSCWVILLFDGFCLAYQFASLRCHFVSLISIKSNTFRGRFKRRKELINGERGWDNTKN